MARNIGISFALGATLSGNFSAAMRSATGQVQGITSALREMERTDVGRLGASMNEQKAKIKGLGTSLREAQRTLTTLRGRADAAGGATGVLARQIRLAEGNVNRLTGQLGRQSAAYRNTVAEATTVSGSVRGLTRDYAELTKQMAAQRATRDRAGSVIAGLRGQQERRDALRQQRADLRGRLAGTVVQAATVAVPVKFAIGFEDSMARVGALARADKEDLAKMTAQARQLGRDTVFSASQAAEGMQYLAMAGFNTKNTMAAMPGLLELAAAGATDLGRSADIASNILSGFKISASEMGRVSDVLAYTFTSSNTTLETLGETMKYVGPVASAVKMSLEDTAAAVGLLGNVGIQGSQAGTALRAALLRLAAPPKMAAEALAKLTGASGAELDEMMEGLGGAREALDQLGVQTKDEAGNLRPLVGILEELNAKTANMGSGERMEIIKKIFGTTSSAAMVALMDQAGKTIDDNGNAIVDAHGNATTALRKYMAEVQNSGGTGARIAKQMNDTTGGALREMRSAFEDVAIVTGNLFTPAIRGIAGVMRTGANAVSALMERFPTLSRVVGLATGAIATLAVGTLVWGLISNTVKTAVLDLAKVAAFMGRNLSLTTLKTRALTVATAAWGVAARAGALASRIFAGGLRSILTATGIGALLVALGFAVEWLIDNWKSVGSVLSGVWDGIVKTVAGAVDGLIAVWGSISQTASAACHAVQDVWRRIGVFFAVLGQELSSRFRGATTSVVTTFQAARDRVMGVWGSITSFFSGLWSGVVGAANSAWTNVVQAAVYACQVAQDIWNGIAVFFVDLWDDVTGLAGAAWNHLTQAADTACQVVLGVWGGVLDYYSWLWQGVVSLASWAWGGISSIWTGATEFFSGIVDGIAGIFSGFFDWLRESFSWLFSAIDSVGSAINKVTGAVSGAWNAAFGDGDDKPKKPAAPVADGAPKPYQSSAKVATPTLAETTVSPSVIPRPGTAQLPSAAPVAAAPKATRVAGSDSTAALNEGSSAPKTEQGKGKGKSRAGGGGGSGRARGGSGRSGKDPVSGSGSGSGPVTIVSVAGDNSKTQTVFIPAGSRSPMVTAASSGDNGIAEALRNARLPDTAPIPTTAPVATATQSTQFMGTTVGAAILKGYNTLLAASPFAPDDDSAARIVRDVQLPRAAANVNSAGAPASAAKGVSVDLKQYFDVSKTDATAVKNVLESIKPDMEALVRRALEKLQSDKSRTLYAQ